VSYREIFYDAADGLNLYARDYGPEDGGLTPLLCLPGLTRNAKDFEAVAPQLSKARRVLCPDFRGRGRSGYAADPKTYRPDVELADTLALLDLLKLPQAAVIGTSRGGIVALVMAAKAPQRLAGILLNDIGPRIAAEGLLRIRSYLGKPGGYGSWAEAIAAMKRTTPGFDSLSEAQWETFARRIYRDRDGRPDRDSDPGLAVTFPSSEDIVAGKVPELWAMFDLTVNLPVMVLRGEHSDLLDAATVAEMSRRHPGLEAVVVRDRGHVPFLDEPESAAAIQRWLSRVDRSLASR